MPKDLLRKLYGLLRKFYDAVTNVAVFSARYILFVTINPAQFFSLTK
jgi:hypothetical protein